jgi:ABC-type polysaccharide/polyol phosphate export permease
MGIMPSVVIRDGESHASRMRRYRDLLGAIARRDVRVRYQLSILGVYWAVLNPLLMATVWSFVFSRLFKMQGLEGIPYLVFFFCSFSLWSFFSNSILSAVGSLTGNASMLAKSYFPRIILPTASVVARCIDFLVSLVILGVFMLIYDVPLRPSALLALPLFVFEGMFTLGVAYLFSSLNVLFRDMQQISGVVLMAWMYLSPVMYPLESVSSVYLIRLNPLGTLVGLQTKAILGGSLAGWWHTACAAGLVCMAMLVVGYLVFRRVERLVSEVL